MPKVDIFKGNMWFAYANDTAHWHMIHAEQVKEILEINKRKERATSLEEYVIEEVTSPETVEKNFENAVGQDSLTRFDAPKRKKRPNNNNRKKKPAIVNDGNKPNAPIKAKNTGNNANAKGGESNTNNNKQGGGKNNPNRNNNKNRNNRNNNNNRNTKPGGNEDKK